MLGGYSFAAFGKKDANKHSVSRNTEERNQNPGVVLGWGCCTCKPRGAWRMLINNNERKMYSCSFFVSVPHLFFFFCPFYYSHLLHRVLMQRSVPIITCQL